MPTKKNPDLIDETGSMARSMDESTSLIGISRTSNVEAKARWVTVEPILFLAFIGIATFPAIRLQYLQQRIATDDYNYTFPTDTNGSCGDTKSSDPDYEIQQQIQQETAKWSLYLNICSYLPLVFTVIAIGKWSDIKGRKVGILVSLIGTLIQGLVYLIVIKLNLSLSLLFIAELVHGLTGGTPLLVSVSLAYIADITTIEQRTFRIVIIETCIILSGLAHLVFGYGIEMKGFDMPFYVLISALIVAILYTILPNVLYESIQFKTGGANFLSRMSKLFHGISDLFVYNEGNRRGRLLLINATFFVLTMANWIRSVVTLYLIGQPFCWSSVLVGIYHSITRSLFSISTIITSKVLGIFLSDIWILYIALTSSIAGMIVLGLAEDTTVVYVAAVVGCLQKLPAPIVRSILSKTVSAGEQGLAFSVLASLDSLSTFVGPMIYQGIYLRTVVLGKPGAPFYAAAGIGGLAVVFAIILHCRFLTSGKHSRT